MDSPARQVKPLASRFIGVDEIQPTVAYAGRGEFSASCWVKGALVMPTLMLVETGRLVGYPPAGKFEATAGSLVCFRPPTRVYGIIAPAIVWELGVRFALAPRQHLVPWLADVGPVPWHVPLGDAFDRARQLTELIFTELPRTTLAEQLRVRGAIFEMLAILHEAARRNGGAAGRPAEIAEMDAWQRARLRLESNVQRPLTVAKLARDLGLTADCFTRRFRRRFGITPFACRTRAKLYDAWRLLREDREQPVKTVAYRLGFRDPKAFARLFKRHLGVSPSQAAGHGPAAPGKGPAVCDGMAVLFPEQGFALPADGDIAPFGALTEIIATAPPPFPSGSIRYRRC